MFAMLTLEQVLASYKVDIANGKRHSPQTNAEIKSAVYIALDKIKPNLSRRVELDINDMRKKASGANGISYITYSFVNGEGPPEYGTREEIMEKCTNCTGTAGEIKCRLVCIFHAFDGDVALINISVEYETEPHTCVQLWPNTTRIRCSDGKVAVL